MGKICRILLLAFVLNTSLATVALARAVYLADGGIIQAQKVWKEEGRIYVLVNRDSLIHFAPEEINLKKTFAAPKAKAVTKSKVTPVAVAILPAPQSASSAAVKPTAATTPAKGTPAAVTVTPLPQSAPSAAVKSTAAAKTPAKEAPAPAAATPPPAVKKPVVAKKPTPPPAPEETPLVALVALGGGLLFFVILLASFWKVFEKAGEAGWKSLIPFYNLLILLRLAGCPNWWFVMFLLPVVNIYFAVVMHIRLAGKFGKPPLFGFALCFLGFIFFPILAFGPATYEQEEEFTFGEDEEFPFDAEE